MGYHGAMSDPTDNDREDVPSVESDPTIVYRPADTVGDVESDQRLTGAFRYALVVERGPQAGLAYVLGEGETIAGRSEEVDIFLGDVTVSRHHAKFTIDTTGLRVEDLGSTNGTYVNLDRTDATVLLPGDEVIIGKFHLIVTVGNA
jgi:pSer/pThr/pTyr-binding forkhead associated (FHA) protein